MSNEIESQVKAALDAAGIEYRATLVQKGVRNDDGWEHDLWDIQLRPLGTMTLTRFDYCTGIGLRKKPAMPTPPYRRGTVAYAQWEASGEPQAPSPASVLHALCADSTAGGMSFAEWCGEYGLDEDSRKAERLYFECQSTDHKLRRVLGRELMAHITELVQEY